MRGLFRGSLGWSLAGVLDSRTVLRICCRSSSEYLGTEKAAGVGPWFKGPAGEPGAAPAGGAEGPSVGEAEGPSNWSSLLGQGRPRLFAVDMTMTMVLRSDYPNGLADPLGLELSILA